MPWQQLILRIDAEDLPRTEALLHLAGAEALSIADDANFPLLEPGPGETPIWPSVVVHALFPMGIDLSGLGAMLRSTVDVGDNIEVAAISDADWLAAWRQHVPTREFGQGFWITPADVPAEPRAARQLRLHMGLAFGTGQHATTAQCLEWLAMQTLQDLRVIDYGCGSGILALAALCLGAERAWAVDNDPQALTATLDNAALNGMRDRLWVGTPLDLPRVEADIVLANIVAGTLVQIAAELAAHARAGAKLALSGILPAQRGEIESAYAPYFDGFRDSVRDDWVCLTAQRKMRSQSVE